MVKTLGGALVGLFVGGLLFSLFELLFAKNDRRWWRRRGQLGDVGYWFMNPIATQGLGKVAIIAAVIVLALVSGVPLRGEAIKAFAEQHRTFISKQPAWAQAIEVMILADFIGYWSHRLMHRGALWRVHAVHHATRELDWLAAARVHPLNEVISRVLVIVPLFALGFRAPVLAAVAPLLTFYAILLHANLTWDFGPLRYVIASPAFHRWHHTAERAGVDKNFSGFLPIWDLVFGTFYLPRGVEPSSFGIDEPMPEGLLSQLIWPFKRRPANAPQAARTPV
jgi:sterol desaturase/sphingolipid hydroxylase (fatty acid hydroxylase superfamily)